MRRSPPSSTIRFFQCLCAVTWCLFAAGIVFGFAALKPILIQEGIYHELCPNQEEICIEQDLKLNKMFTIAAVTTNATALAVGFILDKYGPRVCGFLGSMFLIIASFTLSNNKLLDWLLVRVLSWDKYLVGYMSLAIGGPFVFISCFQLANSFPQYSGMILALLTGAFDTSSAVFLVYRLVYQNVSQVSLELFFQWYGVVPVFIVLCQLFLMPADSYKTIGSIEKLAIEGLDENGQLPQGVDGSSIISDANERSSLLSSNQRRLSIQQEAAEEGAYLGSVDPELGLSTTKSRTKSVYEEYVESKILSKSGHLFGILDGKSLKRQLSSPFFLLMCCFCTVQMIRINYFVATIRSQEEFLLGPQLAAEINNIFDVALPLGGVVAIPFIGVLLDNFQTQTVLLILYLISIAIGLCGVVSSYTLNLVGILVLVTYRPFYYTAISDYSAKVFGFETFGTVYGLMMFTSGLINYFAVYLDRLTKAMFQGNPGPVNWGLIVATCCSGAALLVYIEAQRKENCKLRLQEEAEEAEEVQIPQ